MSLGKDCALDLAIVAGAREAADLYCTCGIDLSAKFRNAGLAQLVEHLICNPAEPGATYCDPV